MILSVLKGLKCPRVHHSLGLQIQSNQDTIYEETHIRVTLSVLLVRTSSWGNFRKFTWLDRSKLRTRSIRREEGVLGWDRTP